ncbi:MarR family winged helix-turn-helix transcriptional regulator [Fimbriiglobus ruber]|uniref:Transcriptional regulator, MarR family n=1 Tax=Fimbriiglobus ruber TaxID=1908690 RepID=A0A225DBY1_9BACT|nr:MarR family transcriptional regulator [Fimbriiglobus ruber]OWK34806.1 Transcriptional regulator, MarR family [Fimbriiglobus ruber]
MGHERDAIDRLINDWRAARPDLDPSPLELVGRVIVLATYLERGVDKALAVHGLTLGQFDILATLRRNATTGGLTPKQLLRSVMLSSGGMTSRLDRIESEGWVVRKADPTDRRGVVVELTPKGRKVIDAATATRFDQAEAAIPPLTSGERRTLTELLRKWLQQLTVMSSLEAGA